MRRLKRQCVVFVDRLSILQSFEGKTSTFGSVSKTKLGFVVPGLVTSVLLSHLPHLQRQCLTQCLENKGDFGFWWVHHILVVT